MGGTLILVFTLLVVMAILLGVSFYSRLMAKRTAAANAWGQVDVQLKRRHDLLRALVVIVRQDLQHDHPVLDSISRARLNAIEAGSDIPQRAQAESALSQAAQALLQLVDGYPDLKINPHVRSIGEDLTATEGRVGEGSEAYNRAARDYNGMLGGFVAHFFVERLDLEPALEFNLDATSERVVPWVLR